MENDCHVSGTSLWAEGMEFHNEQASHHSFKVITQKWETREEPK